MSYHEWLAVENFARIVRSECFDAEIDMAFRRSRNLERKTGICLLENLPLCGDELELNRLIRCCLDRASIKGDVCEFNAAAMKRTIEVALTISSETRFYRPFLYEKDVASVPET